MSARVHDGLHELPFAADIDAIGDEPMRYLDRWRRSLGDLYALPVDGPLLSRSPDCRGVIAVFGEAHQRALLTDIERFVLPVSAAVRLGLPPTLQNLNASVHGMRGSEHERQKQTLARVLSSADAMAVRVAAHSAVADACARMRTRRSGALLAEMRDLVLQASSRLMSGACATCMLSPALLMTYFQLRREAAAPWHSMDAATRETLIRVGGDVDAGLRDYRRAARAEAAHPERFGALAALATAPEDVIDEDRFVAHANVLFMSCNEPVSVALAWTLLALSQLPGLRARLREADVRSGATSSLLDAVLSESLRVLTPNALMVRMTREPVQLGPHRLPADCEVLLCPFLSHREPALFPQPQRFLPSRWSQLRPSTYAYFPFGAGGHGCVGRGLAMRLLQQTMTALIRQGDWVLDGDTSVDWRVHIMLMPADDPQMRFRDASDMPSRKAREDGRLSGGVTGIVELSDDGC